MDEIFFPPKLYYANYHFTILYVSDLQNNFIYFICLENNLYVHLTMVYNLDKYVTIRKKFLILVLILIKILWKEFVN
jgi:hypothetical protein